MSAVRDVELDIERLDSHIDGLEEALEPLLANLEGISSQLPLLDKAKLFSLTAYAIESLLFCKKRTLPRNIVEEACGTNFFSAASLKLEGKDAQTHPVFAELKRVQQYFAKIKAIEEPPEARSLTVNQEATARILKADLVSLI